MLDQPSTRRLALVVPAIGTLVFVVGLFTESQAGYVNGPPVGTSGGFSENTCASCHIDHPLNDKTGSLRLEGISEKYVPGQRYPLTIRLDHPQLERGGFQIVARFASGAKIGQQAGLFEVSDSRAAIVSNPQGTLQYVQHTAEGVSPEVKGSIRWSIAWHAPQEAAGPIVFHMAANAANYDDSPLGDFPYSLESKVPPGP